ncbi:hypothetical protein TRFO_02227 [Tritrichomonas foetus]|uniref:Uncharacterized protein n=1 Tax=Tritrichomonas foetus TaxID=1144522 RepID=A0A1J4J7R5_9EUKA|nr:hypothetical protein TRFO_02227 [Tritrichomonas foetus]|eukprot:OHS95246.1 hypothetical protein TRFO_02227 [Tritrichomonas foetus]
MFSPLTNSQILGFSPNNSRCYAATSLLQHKKTLFAFASDNLVFLFDRLTLKYQIIAIPDQTSTIVSLTFTGYDKDTSLICVDQNGKLYFYLLSDLSKPIYEANLGCTPIAITASNEFLFYKTQYCLNATSVGNNWIGTDKIILSETLVHDKCVVSPCGRGIAAYSRGGQNPVVWYSPFERRRRSNLPINGHISSFEWGTSEHLLAVTATEEGIVRLWIESTTSYELCCVKWFDFGCKVLSAAVCISCDIENQIQLKNCQKAMSDSRRVFPSVKRPRTLIMATIENEKEKSSISLLQEKSLPQLQHLGNVNMNVDVAFATFCDLKRIFSDGELKRLISAVRFSKTSLSFYQFELGKSKLTHIAPLKFDFIRSPIINIFKKEKILTQHEDKVLYDWWKLEKAVEKNEYLDYCNFKEGKIGILSNCVLFDNGTKENQPICNFDYEAIFGVIEIYDKIAFIAVIGKKDIHIYTFDESFKEIPVSNSSSNHQFDNLSITVHSTDLFVVSTTNSIDAYFLSKNHYEKFGTLEADHPCALFIPHPLALIAVSLPQYLKLYIVWYNSFIPIEEIDPNLKNEYPYPQFRTMSILENGVILGANKHIFLELRFSSEDLPKPYSLNSNFTLITSFTLGYFYQLYVLLESQEITIESFTKKLPSESFIFPNNPPLGTPNIITQCCKSPPHGWALLDEPGLRFLFSWIFARNSPDLWRYIPFFGVWALLSKEQSALVDSLNLTSAKMLFDMMLPLWAKNVNILIKAVDILIETTIPSDNEIDTYFLFCILLNKRNTAKKIARVKNETKLANFFSIVSEDAKMRTRIEKSAFEAQKQHRVALSAMFFCLRGMTKQALVVLRDDRLLLVLTARLLGEANWHEYILPHLMDGFYTKWWKEENEGAKQLLRNWKYQRSEILSIELHRLEMLKKFETNEPYDILSVQLTPGFAQAQLIELAEVENLEDSEKESPKQALSEPNKDNEILEIEASEIEDESLTVKEVSTFDFGGAVADDWDDYDGFSSDSSENEDNNESENDANNDSKIENHENINDNELENINEAEKEEEKVEIESNLSTRFLRDIFSSPDPIFFTYNERFVVLLISSILNETYCENSLVLISKIANMLYESASGLIGPRAKQRISTTVAILYTLTLAMSKANMMMTLFMRPLNVESLGAIVAEFMNRKPKMPTYPPNILKRFVTKEVTVKESDRELANFISFHEICKVLISQGSLSRLQMLISFFHHRHRLLFTNLKTFYFSESNYSFDLSTIGLRCQDMSERMQETLVQRKWLVSMVNPFVSPFYFGDHFDASRSFERETHFDVQLVAVCINPQNTAEIAVGSKDGIEFINLNKVKKSSTTPSSPTSADTSGDNSTSMSGTEGLTPFDSPFASLMSPAKAEYLDPAAFYQKREFRPQWKKHRAPTRDLPVTCLASHPREPFFVAGTSSGRIYLSPFGKKFTNTTSSVMYNESSVTSISLNETGDRLLSTALDGYIYVSDFKTANLFVSVEGSTAAWLNNDTQIIVCEPMNKQFVVYDTIAGLSPVATFKLPKRSSCSPIAVCGPYVLTGYDDGSVVQLDLRSQQYSTMKLHESPVTVIKYDSSQRFFVTGSQDNSIKIVNARVDATPQILNDVFTTYDQKSEFRGVNDIAISDRTIVACGHSPSIHAWMVNDPRGLYF